jgi:hypothetical protein
MVDLLASAERCRLRASHCSQSAENTTSSYFANCYRELAKLFSNIADVEEDFVRRDFAAKQLANEKLISETDLTAR